MEIKKLLLICDGCRAEFLIEERKLNQRKWTGQKKFYHNHRCFLKNSKEHKEAGLLFSRETKAIIQGVFDYD